jgi:tRNA A-37 threonylcarbamoyl transferase component Bud32
MAVFTRTEIARGGGPHFRAASLRRVLLGSVAWDIRLELVDALLDDHGLRLNEWRNAGRLRVIKHGPHRTVYRIELAAGTFYLKHFRVADWQARLRNAVRACPAELEHRAVMRVADEGIDTVEVVAVGKTIRGGFVTDSYLISREIADAEQLDDFLFGTFRELSPQRQAPMRQRLAVELGRLAARLHAAGVWHVDFHAGNVLVQLDAADQPRLWLIDLHAAKFQREISVRRRLANLAVLAQFFTRRATRTDGLRFWRAYEEDGGWKMEDGGRKGKFDPPSSIFHPPSDSLDSRLSTLDSYFGSAAERGWRRADRAWARGNRHVRKLDSPTAKCRGVATLDEAWLASIRDKPERLFESVTRWCKRTRSRRVAAIALPNHVGAGEAYWKCLEPRGWFARLPDRFRWSSARRAWEIGHALLRRNILTPRPLAFVEREDADGVRQYLLTEAVPDAVTLDQFARALVLPSPHRGKADLVRELVEVICRLHSSGFDHRDLKWSNILVRTDVSVTPAPHPQPLSPSGGEGSLRVWLLDLDAVWQWPWLPRFRRVQNLSRLAVSSLQHAIVRRTDRLRFLRGYLGDRFAAEWKSWWRQIARRVDSKIARNCRVGRPIS